MSASFNVFSWAVPSLAKSNLVGNELVGETLNSIGRAGHLDRQQTRRFSVTEVAVTMGRSG